MRNISRKAAFMLALLLAFSAASCGDTAESSTEKTNRVGNTSEITETSTEKLTDKVPDVKFDGKEFRTIEQNSNINPLGLEESDGDVVNDAVCDSARKAEDRFDVKIVPTTLIVYGELSKAVMKAVMSDSDEYDLVFGQMFKSGSDAQQGIYMEWQKVPYVNFENPWYVKSINDATVGDKLYMIESELSMTYHKQTWMIVYNKTKAGEIADFPDLYKMVEDGTWTIDQLYKLSSDVYHDLNGDGNRDDNDFYGIYGSTDACMLASFVAGMEGKIVGVDKDLKVNTYINSEKTIDILSKLSKLFVSSDGALQPAESKRKYRMERFTNGKVIFEAMQANDLVSPDFNMRNLSDEFGVLPLPKYDADQTEYYTMVDGGASVMLIPKTVRNADMVGALVEAMSADYYYNVTPVYIGVAIGQKGTRDEESIRIMREIFDSRVIAFDYLYDGFKGWVMQLPTLIKDENTIASGIQRQLGAMKAYYESVVDFLTAK